MFGTDIAPALYFSNAAKPLGGGLDQQIETFRREHPDTNLVIIDTLQKVRESGNEKCSHASDYEIISKLKSLAEKLRICLLLVHHTRKQQAEDRFDMISGTNGLLGCADGALILQKEFRTAKTATLDISGRDQQDQRLYLSRDEQTLAWNLERQETELWNAPPDPVLSAVASLVTPENTKWCGSSTELAAALGTEMKPNALSMRLNIRAAELEQDYHIRINPDTRRETNHFDLSSVTAVTTVTAYCAPKNIVTAVTVVTRRTVLCRFQQSKKRIHLH